MSASRAALVPPQGFPCGPTQLSPRMNARRHRDVGGPGSWGRRWLPPHAAPLVFPGVVWNNRALGSIQEPSKVSSLLV